MNLITGATGLLGSHVALHLLRKGERVRAIRRADSDIAGSKVLLDWYAPGLYEKIEWIEGDVLDVPSLYNAMEGVQCVYHCAAVVSYHKSDRRQMYTINVEGTANVVNVAIDTGVGMLCHVSSIAAIGRTESGSTLNEHSEWKESDLNTHYGISKYLSEMEVWRGIQEGLKAVIVNPGFIIGPGDTSRSSTSVFSKIKEGMPYFPPGGTGFVSVNDVAQAMLRLVEKGIHNERFILVAENGSMKDLFVNIAKALQVRIPSREAKNWHLQAARIFEWIKEKISGKKALVTRETVRNASSRWYYENDKILRTLEHFQFEAIPGAIEHSARFINAH